MEDKLIVDKELFEELKLMMSSSNEQDIIVVLGLIETFDEWNKMNQIYKEQLFEILRENTHIKNKRELKMKIWMSQIN